MRRNLVLFALIVGACGEEPSRCPQGFVEGGTGYANGGCSIEGYANSIDADTGVYGFVKAVAGGCGPGDNSCSTAYEDDYPVQIYAIGEGGLSLEDCDGVDLPVYEATTAPSPIDSPEVDPHVVVHTDDRGRFWAALDPGTYCVTATDTIDDTLMGRTVVVPQGLINSSFVFDHAGY